MIQNNQIGLLADRPGPGDVAAAWVGRLQAALDRGPAAAFEDLFIEQAAWRDLVLMSWTTSSTSPRAEVVRALRERLANVSPVRVTIAGTPDWVTRVGRECLEIFLAFTTRHGRGRGIVRLVESDGAYRGWTLSTALEEIIGHEERRGANRRRGGHYEHVAPGANWRDMREWAVAYRDREPDVLVVGGGQAGLGVAARLNHLEVDTLVVDKWPRIGDNWRQRYHMLALHNETWTCHLPYLEFPDSFPTFLPKDQLANWFEIYVEAMEINYWAGTELVSGAYHVQDGRWTVTLRQGGGAQRVVRPRHIVMATGVSGIPYRPDIPGLSDFTGDVRHTTEFVNGAPYAGQSVVVVGTGNSAHDVAQELHRWGADVTMLQRGSTTVIGLEPAGRLPSRIYHEGRSLDDVDLLAVSTPPPYALRSQQLLTDRMRELDRDLIRQLNDKGFRTDYAEDGGGMLSKYLRRGGGYYINVGACDLIISGEVGLRQWSDVEGFSPRAIRFRDGTAPHVDAIILATGYQPMGAAVERYFGAEVAGRVGQIWGLDETGEVANVWKRTPQPGLWFAAGSLASCRQRSRYLALEIKADLLGLSRS
ncbi:NAD(P)/FAD-dependent oxidoreductase [Luedemannella helvata]|uniref:NAD(P)/FAD-dependent oxidoreductase n=1 Tax=Luedemannella helvata TaxID=349315 RepID=A0ABP4VXP4_9ACTN